MVRHKTVTIAKELADTVKTCLLYLAMSQSNKTYIIEINPFTQEKIYHTYRMTQPNRLVKSEFNPITYKETTQRVHLQSHDGQNPLRASSERRCVFHLRNLLITP